MNENRTLKIKPLQNSYLVELEFRSKTVDDWTYNEELSSFNTWEEVISFVSDNKMDIPPKQI